ncbi:ARM repeat-containing protein [Morchella conica CCBAS932]|uniref:ARM repeat-containing protein n=1 Tax=Morchella conica CCBAS932 TaxID=1392247 RepID=A0A3N4KBX2_9PEZI|nr:ARM repeat-containing protein [Morchella conica CCBAS932]
MSSGVPLTSENLFEVLQAATSQSQELVQNASSQLKSWELVPGYWGMLQDMFLNRSLPVVIRWMSVITLKQGVDKYWRKAATNAMHKEEKSYIRARLISAILDEPSSQLAAQNAVIVGKVARLEYPLEWPDVFTELTTVIRDSSAAPLTETTTLRLTHSLSILLHVVKELATGRLVRTKAVLQSVTPEVFRVLGGVYVKHVELWHAQLGGGQQTSVEMMTITLLCLKILRRLIIAGYEFPNRAPEVQELWQILYGQVWVLFHAESQLPVSGGEELALLRKHVVNMGKLFLDASTSHSAAFALFPGTLPLLGKYWEVVAAHGETLVERSKENLNGNEGSSGEEDRRNFREKVALHGMLLFRSCAKMIFNPVATFKYRHKAEKDENREATEIFKTQLFTPQTVTHCMEVLVTKYFVLCPSDLEGWSENPETWSEHWENATESWEFVIRPCAEKLFMDLVTNYKSILAEPLMRVFNNSISSTDVLAKDAIYTAVGLAAPVLHPSLDFDGFLHNTLVNEIQVQQQGYNILRRRIAILIGQWVSVNVSAESRTTVYKVTQHLLNRDDPYNDLVVRLTAARCLKSSVNEWEFKVDSFLPYVDDLFGKLMGLIDEVEETETRMSLLEVIGLIVERLEHHIAPYAEAIVRILPPLWEQTGEEHLFKQAILTILTKLVSAMKDRSLEYHNIVLPLIKYSVEPGSGMQVYLLEDALDLWEATIRSAPSPASPELIDLAPLLIPCVENGTMTLRKVLDILESYVLLAPREMIENLRSQMFAAFASLLGTLKPEYNSIITHVVEIIIRAAETLGGEQALSVVGHELIGSGFLLTALEGIHASYQAHQTTGPNRVHPPLDTVVMTDYLGVLSRMVLASTGWFVENMRVFGERKGMGVEQVMGWLLEEWFDHFSNIGNPKARKLNCMALTKLLETNEGWVLRRLQDLMVVWTDLVNEHLDNEGGDALIYWVQPEDENAPVTPESSRRKALTQSDPVHAVNVVEFIKHHLAKVQGENGGPGRFREDWVVNVDKYVLEGFAKLGVI